MTHDVDLVILGAGSAGYVGAIRAAQLGMRVTILDPSPVGGTCLHDGCIPTKALLEVSGFLRSLAESARFGVSVSSSLPDPDKLSTFRSGIIDRLTRGIEFLFKKHGITHIRAKGTLVAPGIVRILDGTPREIRGRFVLLSTGSRPRPLPGLAFDGRQILSSTDLLRRSRFDGRVAIVGGGAIGCEFADILSAFGSRVFLLEKEPRILPLEDTELGEALARELSGMGVEVRTGVSSLTVVPGASDVSIRFGDGGGREEDVRVDAVLVAIGREPVTEGLGLENLGLATGKGGFLPLDPFGETSVRGLYAAGDLAGGYLLAHKASHEAIVAVEAMAGRNPRSLDPALVPRVVYTHPEVVSIGLTKAQAEREGVSVVEGRFPLMANGRSLIEGNRRGFFKVLSDRETGRLVGFHGIGPHVSEMVATVAVAMAGKEGASQIMDGIFPHPTVSEALHEAFLDLAGLAIHR
ncbi:MAG: dihydrolipoyl dehydrogenase [Nitrospirae bacterium]|nr:dihydrolipoyl dehydrogenase [Nitrospirota bacterium]MCL5286085.1 dihydrolipoyl dehydrogenase [Nitrospirota bacterium]